MTILSPANRAILAPAASKLLSWLRDDAWPLWLAQGIDRAHAGFHEHLALDTVASTADFRRLRVVTRQIIVFAEAARLEHDGLPPAARIAALEAVSLGLAFLDRFARTPTGGYAWRFDLKGAVTDARHDLYDHAFVLLALATAYRVLPSSTLRAEVQSLDRFLQGKLRHRGLAYLEGLPPSLPRRQNPHMHLVEAYLAAAEAFDEPQFLERADELVEVFLSHLFQWHEGALPEFYDDRLTPLREGGRFVVEPGHHAEWVWLLDWHGSLCRRRGRVPPPESRHAIRALLHFIDNHGLHPETGALFDEVWSDGAPRATGARLWPQTERLKAELVRPDATTARIGSAFAVLEPYLDIEPRGLWYERRVAEGHFTRDHAPASSLYHLTCAGVLAHRLLASPRHREGSPA
jgi:mannose/cellobiose epimerase-like protein (N-acyl-D-glucosamine 2-epimerase family)